MVSRFRIKNKGREKALASGWNCRKTDGEDRAKLYPYSSQGNKSNQKQQEAFELPLWG